jgi:hypothetical protein
VYRREDRDMGFGVGALKDITVSFSKKEISVLNTSFSNCSPKT